MIPPEVRTYLRPDEVLLWWGRPDPAKTFTRGDAELVPFSIVLATFAVFWESNALSANGSPVFALFGLPLVAVGAHMTVGRFFYKRSLKRRTVYAVTNQRAIVAVGATSLVDGPLRHQPLNVRRSRNGRHTDVIIGSGISRESAIYANSGMDGFTRVSGGLAGPAFYDVTDGAAMLHAIDIARSGGQ